jgi:hypothetical protein
MENERIHIGSDGKIVQLWANDSNEVVAVIHGRRGAGFTRFLGSVASSDTASLPSVIETPAGIVTLDQTTEPLPKTLNGKLA